MALVNEVKRTGAVTDYQYITLTGGMRKKGGKVWLRHRRGKRSKVERGVNLMQGGTHSELMHSKHFAMRPMTTLRVCFESQRLPALPTSVHVDENGHRVSF